MNYFFQYLHGDYYVQLPKYSLKNYLGDTYTDNLYSSVGIWENNAFLNDARPNPVDITKNSFREL